MKRTIFGLIFLATLMVTVAPVFAQQAGENINVLPVVSKIDPVTLTENPNWYLEGDAYLQRQVEPTIAASTRNPDHLLAFFNDYRAVDAYDDPFLGEEYQTASLALTVADFMLAGLVPLPDLPHIQHPPVAAAEAWVGMSRSFDGGLTWSGGFLPGFPFEGDLNPDELLANQSSPVYGLEAATDPVLAPAPCGYFYVVFMAFDRGGQSKLSVARYQDLNNDEGGDTIEYQGTTVIEVGNNAMYGFFLDKPDIEVDIWRGPDAPNQCAHRVYTSYSTFNGLDNDGKFQSKINFAWSEDFGETFTKQKLNPPYQQNQGSALAVDPNNGTIYMTWRHFFSPDAILITKSTNYGIKWNKPVMLTVAEPLQPFDQPTISTATGKEFLAFRSNGFPTAAVNDEGTVFVAWQERVDHDADPGEWAPLSWEDGGSPRIVLMRSIDGGKNWSGLGENGARIAVDNFYFPKPYNAGVGGAWQATYRGPQVMPKLSFGGGRLMLAYYESRGLIGFEFTEDDPPQQQEEVNPTDLTPNSGYPEYITNYDRVIDFRAALLDPNDGSFESSIQISRYPIRANANLGNGQDLDDVARVFEPCGAAPSSADNPPCARQVNRANVPTSAAGTSPFIGDYADLVPMLQFVPNENQTGWRWATEAADVPYRGFHAIFTDNRHIVPPWDDPYTSEWLRYLNYGPPGAEGACTNAGSRNSNVLTSRVTADVVVSTPTTYKLLGSQPRTFPFSVNNRGDEDRYFFVAVTDNSGPASFSPTDPDVEEGYIKVFPYSSVSQVLYVDENAALPTDVFRVAVYSAECQGYDDGSFDSCSVPCLEADDCLLGTASFNADQSVEGGLVNIGSADPESQNPFVLNPFVLNPFVLNETSTNTSPSNPFVLNPFVLNPFVLNSPPPEVPSSLKHTKAEGDKVYPYDIIDTTWVVQTDQFNNTASTQLPVINVDNAEQFVGNYAFQLIVYKTSSITGYREALDANNNPTCEAYNIEQDQILSNVYQDPGAENPFVLNPFVLNPFVLNDGAENPFVLNPFVLNSTFTMAPPDDAVAQIPDSTSKSAIFPDDTVKAPRAPNEIKITLRAFQLKPFCEGENTEDCIHTEEELVYDPLIDPPSAAVASMKCVQEALYATNNPDDPVAQANAALCFNTKAPDLVAQLRVVDEPLPQESTVGAGNLLIFPVNGWTLTNQGYGLAWAENRELRHGFLLSNDDVVGLPDDSYIGESIVDAGVATLTDLTNGFDIRLAHQVSSNNPLAPDARSVQVLTTGDTEFSSNPAPGDWLLVTLGPSDDQVSIIAESVVVDASTLPGLNQIAGTFDDWYDGGFTLIAAGQEDFGAGSLPIPSWVPPGFYNVILFVDDFKEVSEVNEPNNATVTFEIEVVIPNYPPVVDLGEDFPATEGLEIVFAGASYFTDPDLNDPDSSDSHTFEWNFGDGSLPITDRDTTHTYVDEGTYEVTFTVTDSFGETASDKVLVIVTNVPPTAGGDQTVSIVQGTSATIGLSASDPGANDTVYFDVETAPVFGTVEISPITDRTAEATYEPFSTFCGVDSFTYGVSDDNFETPASDSAVVTIYVAAAFDWTFVGLKSPLNGVLYTAKAGSVIPLSWEYVDSNNSTVDSEGAEPNINFKGWIGVKCGDDPIEDPIDIDFDLEEDPGSSELRYSSGVWQFNWQTKYPEDDPNAGDSLPKGCYEIRITDKYSCAGEADGPFQVQLK